MLSDVFLSYFTHQLACSIRFKVLIRRIRPQKSPTSVPINTEG